MVSEPLQASSPEPLSAGRAACFRSRKGTNSGSIWRIARIAGNTTTKWSHWQSRWPIGKNTLRTLNRRRRFSCAWQKADRNRREQLSVNGHLPFTLRMRSAFVSGTTHLALPPDLDGSGGGLGFDSGRKFFDARPSRTPLPKTSPSPEMILTWRQQEQLLAELIGPNETRAAAGRRNHSFPRPSSERRFEILTT